MEHKLYLYVNAGYIYIYKKICDVQKQQLKVPANYVFFTLDDQSTVQIVEEYIVHCCPWKCPFIHKN